MEYNGLTMFSMVPSLLTLFLSVFEEVLPVNFTAFVLARSFLSTLLKQRHAKHLDQGSFKWCCYCSSRYVYTCSCPMHLQTETQHCSH